MEPSNLGQIHASAPSFTSTVPVVISVSLVARGQRKVSSDDRWHLKPFSVYNFSVTIKDSEDTVSPKTVQHRFRYVDRLHRALLARNIAVPKQLDKGSWFSNPPEEKRLNDLQRYMDTLIQMGDARASVLLKAFFVSFKLLHALLNMPLGGDEKTTLYSCGAEGACLWQQHCTTPDFATWIEIRSRTAALHLQLQDVRQAQAIRLSNFIERRTRREQTEKELVEACSKQQCFQGHLLEQQSSLLKLQEMRHQRCKREEERLQRQQQSCFLCFFPGTYISRYDASRDTGWKADNQQAQQDYATFLSNMDFTAKVVLEVEVMPAYLRGLHHAIAQDKAAVVEATIRSSWEERLSSGDINDDDVKAAFALRQEIDEKTRKEKSELTQEEESIDQHLAITLAQGTELPQVMQLYADVKVLWQDALNCLQVENRATSSEMQLIRDKVTALYNPVDAQGQIADALERCIVERHGNIQHRYETYCKLQTWLQALSVATDNEIKASQTRLLHLQQHNLEAQSACELQGRMNSIGPRAFSVSHSLQNEYTTSCQQLSKGRDQLGQLRSDISAAIMQLRDDEETLESAYVVWKQAENPRTFPGQIRSSQKKSSIIVETESGVPDSHSKEVATLFWQALMDAANMAVERCNSLESGYQDTIEALQKQKNMADRSDLFQKANVLETSVFVELRQDLDVEWRELNLAKEIHQKHEGFRQSRVDSLKATIVQVSSALHSLNKASNYCLAEQTRLFAQQAKRAQLLSNSSQQVERIAHHDSRFGVTWKLGVLQNTLSKLLQKLSADFAYLQREIADYNRLVDTDNQASANYPFLNHVIFSHSFQGSPIVFYSDDKMLLAIKPSFDELMQAVASGDTVRQKLGVGFSSLANQQNESWAKSQAIQASARRAIDALNEASRRLQVQTYHAPPPPRRQNPVSNAPTSRHGGNQCTNQYQVNQAQINQYQVNQYQVNHHQVNQQVVQVNQVYLVDRDYEDDEDEEEYYQDDEEYYEDDEDD